MTAVTGYSLAQAGAEEQERARLGLLEEFCDPITARMLNEIGVGDGWRCLDVGAGSGSVTKLLAQRVGATGSVLAIDLDTRLLQSLASDRVEVRQHDLLLDPLPEAAFDLVHARHLLMHLPSRLDALERMLSAVRQGGFLALGDVTMADVELCGRDQRWERVWSSFLDALVQTGWDARYGDRLIGDLESLGLVGVRAERVRSYERGGSLFARLLSGTINRLRERMDASTENVEAALKLLADPATAFRTWTLITAWGQRA
jgi:SAM-dependent methyltransferase